MTGDPPRSLRGRYAPSPTGELHLGNAATALLAWLSIRSAEGCFVMRMEDLDRNRVVQGSAERILDDLAWLGLDWDEGPNGAGPHGPYVQSERDLLYAESFEKLRSRELLYPCFCSRKDIAAAASAPQDPGDELRYPGTCRELAPAAARARIEAGERHAWRFRVTAPQAPSFDDLVHGPQREGPPPGDFVVYRADGVPAYQLAVVVDDAGMLIDEVVRGDDLLPSTPRQLLLFQALGWPAPRFGHVPLWLGRDGVRLSKRHRGVTLRELRHAGHEAPAIVGRLAQGLGLRPTADRVAAGELIEGFAWSRIAPRPGGLRVDPSSW